MSEEEEASCASSRQELSQQRRKAQGEVGENTSSLCSIINHSKRSEPSAASTGNGDHHRHRAQGRKGTPEVIPSSSLLWEACSQILMGLHPSPGQKSFNPTAQLTSEPQANGSRLGLPAECFKIFFFSPLFFPRR